MLTTEQKACNAETWQHINKVQHFLNLFIKELIDRGNSHDKSKLESPEVEYFTEFTDKLAATDYGSKEFNDTKAQMQPALDHHYANNRHHPEHFKNGISDMNLIDLIEMFCDWKASSLRHNTGNLLKSIEINAKRFNMSEQLTHIFENTADFIEQ